MAVQLTAGTVPPTRLLEGETAAAIRTIRDNSSDSLVKAVMRDRDQKLFSGMGTNKALLFDEYAENLLISLSDFNPVYAPFFGVTPAVETEYSQTANAKVYIVLFKTTEGVAKDWVKDAGGAAQDGRRSFLVLMYRCKPVSIQSLSLTKSLIRGVTINGKKSPETAIKNLVSYGKTLRAADSYSDFQIASDIIGALGTDYTLLVTTLNTTNRDTPGVLTSAYVKEAVLEFYEDNHKNFTSQAPKTEDSAAAAAAALTKGGGNPKGGNPKGGNPRGRGGDKGDKDKDKVKDPPDCTACGEGKHWFRDCPLLKELREKRGVATPTSQAAPVTTETTPTQSLAAVQRKTVRFESAAPAADARSGPCPDDFSSDEEVMCAVEQDPVPGSQLSPLMIVLSLALLAMSVACLVAGAPGIMMRFMAPFLTTSVAAATGLSEQFGNYMIDCGATVHMTRNRSSYTRFSKQHKQMRFKVAADVQSYSQGIGDVDIPVWNHVSESMEVLHLTGVYYCPQQPFDLISMDRLMEDLGYDNPDFRARTWSSLDGTAKHTLVKSGRLYYFKCEGDDAQVTAPTTEEQVPSGVRNTENWAWIKSEAKKYALLYGNPQTGKFDVDLFTCGGAVSYTHLTLPTTPYV